MTPIVFEHATKRYGGITAVDAVSLHIEEGEFCALLGPNGAGKTTCIKMLLDFTRPTSGNVFLDGLPSTAPPARSHVGYLCENFLIPPHLSARAYLKRAAALCGMSGASAARRIDFLLELVGMKDRCASPARTYSKGMVQRTGLAAALVNAPKILLLDEPVSGLDPIGIRDVRRVLEGLKPDRVTVLLSSHLLSEAEKVCTTAAIINRGKLALRESMENLLEKGGSLEDIFMQTVQAP